MEVVLFVTDDGRCPYLEWFEGLSDRMALRSVRARLSRIRGGNLGDVRAIGGGVSEMRLDFGPGYRICSGRIGTKVVLLRCAGDKGTQGADIAAARRHRTRYEERLHGDG